MRTLYDGDLHFQTPPAERPFVFANFVSTLDGVVSYAIKGQSSGSVLLTGLNNALATGDRTLNVSITSINGSFLYFSA